MPTSFSPALRITPTAMARPNNTSKTAPTFFTNVGAYLFYENAIKPAGADRICPLLTPQSHKCDSSPYNKGSLFVYNQPPLCKGRWICRRQIRRDCSAGASPRPTVLSIQNKLTSWWSRSWPYSTRNRVLHSCHRFLRFYRCVPAHNTSSWRTAYRHS